MKWELSEIFRESELRIRNSIFWVGIGMEWNSNSCMGIKESGLMELGIGIQEFHF